MSEDRFLLADYIQIVPLDEYFRQGGGRPEQALLTVANPDGYVLIDKMWHRSFVINPAIKVFLEIFRTPMTKSQAIQLLAGEAGCSESQIESLASRFLKRMFHQRVLLNANVTSYRDRRGVLAAGQPFSQYVIAELISPRANVELYLAHDSVTKQAVVIKVLTPFHQGDIKVRSRLQSNFEREFNIMRSLPSHKHVCQCLAYSGREPVHAVLEYVDGPQLRDYLRGNTSIHERLRLCSESLSAVAHLHSNRLLHGDIHLDNFLLTGELAVKLVDFGLSYYEDELKNGDQLPHGGIPHFIPPERIGQSYWKISDRPGDRRSEVFQMGILLYRILSGKSVFPKALTWKQLADTIIRSETEPPSVTPEGEIIPQEYANIVLRALSRTPDRRFPSVCEMMDEWRKVRPACRQTL